VKCTLPALLAALQAAELARGFCTSVVHAKDMVRVCVRACVQATAPRLLAASARLGMQFAHSHSGRLEMQHVCSCMLAGNCSKAARSISQPWHAIAHSHSGRLEMQHAWRSTLHA